MVDLSKHLDRAKQAIERRNYDLALEITTECQDIDPANLENYVLLLDAAKRRAREGGKKGLGLRLKLSKDPHKQLNAAVKAVAKNPDLKALMDCGDAAIKVGETGAKGMHEVAILFYEEARATGLFNKDLLWNLAQAYYQKFQATKDGDALERAINTMAELHRNDPSQGEAARTVKNWEAMRSMSRRAGGGDDYRSQLADSGRASRQEVMNRAIRTAEDAEAVLAYVGEDLQENPEDKALWLKKGDVHRRMQQFDEARAAYQRAAQIDAHDFSITARIGDVDIAQRQADIKRRQAAGEDVSAALQELAELEIQEYSKRVKAQPTEMGHRYHLAIRLFKAGRVDEAAGEFQQAVKDPRFRKDCHKYLGHCFAKKGLLDLAQKQFTECLSLLEDHMSDEYKEALYNRARVSEAMNATDAAIEDYTKLVEVDLGYKDAATRLGQLRS